MALTKITGGVIDTTTSITAVGATFSGSVSVAGTITYDDVTNIDSVGLVTARSGIVINDGGLIVTGVTTVSAGSASVPSISPSGDGNTGIFFPSADTIAFAEGGAEAARIDSSGRLLIGTSTASTYALKTAQLQISGSNENTSSLSLHRSSGSPYLLLSTGSTSGTAGSIDFHGYDGTSAYVALARITGVWDGTGGVNDGPGRLVFYTNADGASTPTERMRIDSSGNMGLGTASPDYKLTVADTSSYVIANLKSSTTEFCGIYFGDTDATSRGTIVYDNSADAMTFRTNGSGEDMRIDSSGRLLVGTSSNRTGVQVQLEGTSYATSSASLTRNENGAGGPLLWLNKSRGTADGSFTIVQDDDNLGTIDFGGSDGSADRTAASISCYVDGTPGSADMPGRLVFSTTADGASSPTERMRIRSDGNIYLGSYATRNDPALASGLAMVINDTANGAQLQLRGQSPKIYFDSTGGGIGEIYLDGSSLAFFANDPNSPGSERLRIDSSGRLLVGTSTARTNLFNGSTFSPTVQIETTTTSGRGLSIINNTSADTGAILVLAQSRGDSIGSNTALVSGRTVGLIDFQGNDGAEFVPAARIEAFVDGTPGSNDMPGRIVFSTTADGNSTPEERMRITSTGQITWANTDAVLESHNTASDARIRGAAVGCNIYIQSYGQTGVYQSGTGWVSASSARLKNVVGSVDSEQCWDFVKGVNLYRYYFKEDPQEGVPYFGPMAEEIGELDPEMLLETNQTDEQGPIYSFNLPLMEMKAFAALQTALSRIEQLEAKVAALEAN